MSMGKQNNTKCACGCGEFIRGRGLGYGAKFSRGHEPATDMQFEAQRRAVSKTPRPSVWIQLKRLGVVA